MLHEMLAKVAEQYAYERAKPFSNSKFGNFVRHDIAMEAKKRLIFTPFDLTVKSSVGAGNWAAVPWLAYFDPLITNTATRGFYVVYLINAQDQSIYLSLNQGTTQIYEEFGVTKGTEVLKRRAVDMRERVPEFAGQFSSEHIELGSTDRLPSGYMAGHSFGRRYTPDDIDAEAFYRDLEQMLNAYEVLIDRGGTTPLETMMEDSGSNSIEEIRRYTLARRIERTSKVRKKVLEVRAPVCEGCQLDPVVHYSYSGPLANTPLDVHHSNPIMTLNEGESRRYKIPDDFLVLCPTCHRMIHKQSDSSDLETLKSQIKIRHKI